MNKLVEAIRKARDAMIDKLPATNSPYGSIPIECIEASEKEMQREHRERLLSMGLVDSKKFFQSLAEDDLCMPDDAKYGTANEQKYDPEFWHEHVVKRVADALRGVDVFSGLMTVGGDGRGEIRGYSEASILEEEQTA